MFLTKYLRVIVVYCQMPFADPLLVVQSQRLCEDPLSAKHWLSLVSVSENGPVSWQPVVPLCGQWS